MPIKIQEKLPAEKFLSDENIFVMTEKRALSQNIRPLKIVILNLMPQKIETETQLLRVLSNTPLQVEVELMRIKSHESKNTSQEHLLSFYKTFDDFKDRKFDGMIITGAPVEKMKFEEVDYWDELVEIMEWSKINVTSTFHICWGAQAGLYYHFNIPKYDLSKKMFGVFEHEIVKKYSRLTRGFNDKVLAPHSRHTEVKKEDILKQKDLEIIVESNEAGLHIIGNKNGRQFFVMGHGEYEAGTLANEYKRDLEKNEQIEKPKNYFPYDDETLSPIINWRSDGTLLYSNWLNYFVYQTTPYNIDEI